MGSGDVRCGVVSMHCAADKTLFESPRLHRALQMVEDSAHLVVAAFLVLLAGVLTVGVVEAVVEAVRGPYSEQAVVVSTLDHCLVLFIVAELLHTVRLAIMNHVLDAEPFLVVGLVACIRKLLTVTAGSDVSFDWHKKGAELPTPAAVICGSMPNTPPAPVTRFMLANR
ncbi:phosphate-starvation-inducible PsiE family protein [Streptomyces sp. NPDC096136]|uniref:phosphate-starvation-inducible PsiE family protein n=1 Tax=Streptomyces sp. NPDC096136 TaxID=3366076 RepID=UPI0037F90CB5